MRCRPLTCRPLEVGMAAVLALQPSHFFYAPLQRGSNAWGSPAKRPLPRGIPKAVVGNGGVGVEEEVCARLLAAGYCTSEVESITGTQGLRLDPQGGLPARLAQIDFLVEQGVFKSSSSMRDYVTRMPWSLELDFQVVYEDERFLVINKPHGVRMNAGKEGLVFPAEVTCEGWVRSYLPELKAMRFCHQLDYATSGLLVIAKDRHAAGACSRLFQERLARKQYTALVFGHPTFNRVEVNQPICSVPTHRFRMQLGHPLPQNLSEEGAPGAHHVKNSQLKSTALIGSAKKRHHSDLFDTMAMAGGVGRLPDKSGTETETKTAVQDTGAMRRGCKSACTVVTVLKRGRLAVRGQLHGVPVSMVRLEPLTGRRHQLRLHCLGLGHPVVGDMTYAGDQDSYRMFLHAARLDLPLGTSGSSPVV
ncbi:unnamed protein product, partial [Discosporangium mesarthrocarpum]